MNELEKQQKKHEKNAAQAQKEIQRILDKRKLALVANYVKELNTVHLELIPHELLDARNEAMRQAQETLESPGDPITPVSND